MIWKTSNVYMGCYELRIVSKISEEWSENDTKYLILKTLKVKREGCFYFEEFKRLEKKSKKTVDIHWFKSNEDYFSRTNFLYHI